MTVLAALDGSEVGLELLSAANTLAKAGGWNVRIVTVVAREGDQAPYIPEALSRGAEVVTLVGDPAEMIVKAGRKAGATMVAIGLRSDDRSGIGHVADAVLRRSTRPVLVFRSGMRQPKELRRMLVPLEGSPSSSAAMRQADDAFCKRGREIVMLHVVTSDNPAEPGSMPAPRIVDQEHYEWASWQEEFAMRFSQCTEGGRHRVSVRAGEPGEVILQEARRIEAELIVLSWGQSLEDGRSQQVKELLESSPCPLLLVRQAPKRV
jgi:nucleotide-binding universal stress UspA family protein